MPNIFLSLPHDRYEEQFLELAARAGTRIERIVSTGQATPQDKPYCQDHDEWVLLLKGAARLWLDGESEQQLNPGDWLVIPAGCRHRVTWTIPGEPTIWLAVHFARSAEACHH